MFSSSRKSGVGPMAADRTAANVPSDDVPSLSEAGRDETADVVDSEDGRVFTSDADDTAAHHADRTPRWGRVVAFAVLPALALVLTVAAGYLKWQDGIIRDSQAAAAQSVRLATEDTIAMLSYQPDTVEKDLTAAQERTTGTFRDSYTRLIAEVVIPGAKERRVSAVATVVAAASISATQNHAVVLVFVNQTTTVGSDAPTTTASTVRVTLEKISGSWLVSQFEPV
jgi:Mce-associated membrane protein